MIDHKTMKMRNQLLILQKILEHEPVSRLALKGKTGLSWGTTTTMINELIDSGIVAELRIKNTKAGRKPAEIGMNKEGNRILGIRFGASFIKAILLDVTGSVVSSFSAPTNAEDSKEGLIRQITDAVDMLIDESSAPLSSLAGIGFAAPGAIDLRNGICLYAPHHPHWSDVPITKILEKRYQLPTFMSHVNDCFALGEKWFGHGKDLNNFVCVLIGTGISAGLIIDGRVYRGFNDTSGEFGHICVDPEGLECVCGRKGCLEAYASGYTIEKKARQLAERNRSGRLSQLAGENGGCITSETIFRAANEGDPDAIGIFREMGRYLGRGISILINILNPEEVILGGGISHAHEFFLPAAREAISENAWKFSRVDLEISTLDDGAVLGAGALVLEEIYQNGLLLKKSSP
jgi:glucokinase-like ROK family protein